MSKRATVSVIVPFHQGGPALERCVDALGRSTTTPLEVIGVADGASDGSAERLEARGLRVVRIPGPGGPARARNHGARAATGDVLFFVDADTAVHPSTIGTVIRELEAHPEVSALIGSYDDAPPERNFLSQYKNLLQHYVHQVADEEGFTFWGACGAIRREIFLDVGGFDERYTVPCIEDIELGYRLVAAGHRIRLCKDLWVTHLKRWTASSLLKSDILRRALPWSRLILQSGHFDDDLNIDRAARLKVAGAGALAALLLASGPFPPALAPAAGVATALLAADWPLVRFFAEQRGAGFATAALGWHWLSYLYSGAAFGAGLGLHLRDKLLDRVGAPAGSAAL